jgi:hypothetical protein
VVGRTRNGNDARPLAKESVTRIVRWTGPPAVVRVKTPADVTVAIPSHLARAEVLDLASLVLSHGEYRELCRAIEGTARRGGSAQRPGHPRLA